MNRVITFTSPARVISKGTAVGRKEMQGPLSGYFDISDDSDKFGKKTFEQAESEMQRLALTHALRKGRVVKEDVGAVFAGDLSNQCTSSSYGLADFNIPFLGLYGACSTMAESLLLAALTVDRGVFRYTAAVASSHNSVAERQFRFPLEYGSQRPPSAQWTVTAAAAFLLGSERKEEGVYITEALVGRIVDMGITDQSNMGAAMAPAAASSILEFAKHTENSINDADMILTGDLGIEGHLICKELLLRSGIDPGDKLKDCGMLIYDPRTQDTHSGGSGCGCSGAVTAGYVMHLLEKKKVRDVILCGTGALMSPSSLQQGLSIAGIGHIVRFRSL